MIPSFAFNTTASILFGNGFLSRLGDLARMRMGGRVLLVTDQGLVLTGIVARAEQILRDAAMDFVTFTEVKADPAEAVILRAVAAA